MFEINPEIKIKKEYLLDTTIFIVDDFYKNPHEVFNLLFNREIPLWKMDQKPSYNTIHFEDRRTEEYNYALKPVYEFLQGLCGQTYDGPFLVTNVHKFYKHDFNDYKNCIWWPHRDTGYNGIVYFSDECGTNLYSPDFYDKSARELGNEHKTVWVKKEKYKKLKTIESKFNRLAFFDGLKFPHGMDIYNDKYFYDEYRYNQVFFFDNPTYKMINTHRDI